MPVAVRESDIHVAMKAKLYENGREGIVVVWKNKKMKMGIFGKENKKIMVLVGKFWRVMQRTNRWLTRRKLNRRSVGLP